MNIQELFDLAMWVDREMTGRGIVGLYGALHSVLESNAQPNAAQQSFESEKDALLAALREVDPAVLSREQQDFLQEAKITPYVGEAGAANVEDLLFRNVIDVQTAANKLSAIISTLNAGVNNFKAIETSLRPFVVTAPEPLKDVLMRVVFTGEASISNIVELEHWSEAWERISRGLAVAAGYTAEDVRVVGASQGSIIVECLLVVGLANVFITAINKALDATLKILDIRLKFEEVRKLGLKDDSVENLLTKALSEARNDKLKEIAKAIVDSQVLPKKLDNEKTGLLDMSVKELVNFLEKRGEVDFVLPQLPEPTAEEESVSKDKLALQQMMAEQRALQNRILALEARVGSDCEDGGGEEPTNS